MADLPVNALRLKGDHPSDPLDEPPVSVSAAVVAVEGEALRRPSDAEFEQQRVRVAELRTADADDVAGAPEEEVAGVRKRLRRRIAATRVVPPPARPERKRWRRKQRR